MRNLAEKEYCTGCTACASACPRGCIAMVADENGFLCPQINVQLCTECGLCEKICPILHPLETGVKIPQSYAAYSKDEAMRLESSSGGVFTELAKAVFKRDGAVFGAAYNEQFEIVHIGVENDENLAKLRGAKYAQSDLRGVFSEVKMRLDIGQEVLFSGTPCQVGGLKAFLRKDYENLLTVDFVCHSVPSPVVWREYVKRRADQDNSGKLPEVINLRSKITGWSHYRYSNWFAYRDGSSHIARNGESLYMKLFIGGFISRESCTHCQFKGYSRVSDLTIGDFWGIWDIAPEMDDDKGTSVVLVQSEQGAELLQRISEHLVLKSVTLGEASQQNGAILKVSQPNDKRLEALELIRTGRISSCEIWFTESELTMIQRACRVAKRFLRRGNN